MLKSGQSFILRAFYRGWIYIFLIHSQFPLFILRGDQFVICIDYLDAAAVFSILDEMRASKECSCTKGEDDGDNEEVDDKDHNDVEEEDTE